MAIRIRSFRSPLVLSALLTIAWSGTASAQRKAPAKPAKGGTSAAAPAGPSQWTAPSDGTPQGAQAVRPPPPGPLRAAHSGAADRFAEGARAQYKVGNCSAALDLYDLAVEGIQDPLLYRDRGLCHEKLGHVFPAIDDFRMYLTMKPEAQDAEDIRARLATLESTEAAERKAQNPKAEAEKKDDVRYNVGPAAGEKMDTAHAEELRSRAEDAEQAMNSSLRLGTGVSLGPYLGMRGIFGGGTSQFGVAFGGQLRWSVGRAIAIVGEVGYASVGTTAPLSGLQTMVGLEGRIRLDKTAANQLTLVGGLGFEHLSSSLFGTSTSFVLPPRVRFGYRHVFGPSLAWDIGLDAAPFLSTASGGSAAFALGGQTGLQIGF